MWIVPVAEGHLDPERIRKMEEWFRVNMIDQQKTIISLVRKPKLDEPK